MQSASRELEISVVLEVEDDRPLVAVRGVVVRGATLGVGGRAPAARVVAGRRLDLDHVGAEVAQRHRRERPGENPREIRHKHTFEGSHGAYYRAPRAAEAPSSPPKHRPIHGQMSVAATPRLGARRASASRIVLRFWQAALVAGLALLAAHDTVGFAAGSRDLFDHWLYEGLEAAAAVGCLVRAARIRAERGAWLALGVALLSTTGGDVIYDFGYGGSPPFPSLADVFYLGFYPASYLGIVLLVRGRISSFNASLWLDGFTAALAAGALGASAILEVVVQSTHGSPIVVLTNLSYPLGDIVLLSLLVFVFTITGWRPGRAWLLIGAALLLNTIGDGIYLYLSAQGSYVEGGVLDVLWPASLILIGLSAWHAPARKTAARRARAANTLCHTGRLRADRCRACSWTPRSRTYTLWRSASPPSRSCSCSCAPRSRSARTRACST